MLTKWRHPRSCCAHVPFEECHLASHKEHSSFLSCRFFCHFLPICFGYVAYPSAPPCVVKAPRENKNVALILTSLLVALLLLPLQASLAPRVHVKDEAPCCSFSPSEMLFVFNQATLFLFVGTEPRTRSEMAALLQSRSFMT